MHESACRLKWLISAEFRDVSHAQRFHRALVQAAQQVDVLALSMFQQQRSRDRVLGPFLLQTLPQSVILLVPSQSSQSRSRCALQVGAQDDRAVGQRRPATPRYRARPKFSQLCSPLPPLNGRHDQLGLARHGLRPGGLHQFPSPLGNLPDEARPARATPSRRVRPRSGPSAADPATSPLRPPLSRRRFCSRGAEG